MALSKIAALVAVATLLWAPGARAETPDMAAFNTACSGAQDFLLGDVEPGVDAAAALEAVCACLATNFTGFSQAEIDVLATDLAGTSTEESRIAFGDYATLESKAADGLDTCFSDPAINAMLYPDEAAQTSPDQPASGQPTSDQPTSDQPSTDQPSTDQPMTVAEAADTGEFSAQCLISARLLETLSTAPAGAEAARRQVCGCLVADLGARLDQAGIDLLAMGFDHPLTEAERASYPDSQKLGEAADGAFTTCVAAASAP